jgi:hypothetical protein
MLEFDLFNYYNQVKDHNILISFKGALSQEILVEMGDFIKNKISIDKKIKKIFAVFIELAQNIMRYSEEREVIGGKSYGIGVITFTEDPQFFNIYSGNIISKTKAPNLSSQIQLINSLNDEEIKNMYNEQIRKPIDDNKMGAGLGLLEIARKSIGRIDFQIENVDESYAFLVLSVKIKKGD